MTNSRKILWAIIPLLAALISMNAAGCGKNKKPEERLVAKINNYDLTVQDFQDEARTIAPNKYLPQDEEKAKEEILDDIIIKKILLQEAQAENFDKDRAFMKEIERYWEQALLKILIRTKMQNFAQMIKVTDEEVKKEYDRLLKEESSSMESFTKVEPDLRREVLRRKVKEAFDKWLETVKKNAKVVKYKENIKTISIK